MDISREKKAINAYLKLLEKKGAKSGALYKRSHFLDQLAPLLVNKEQTRYVYSEAVNKLMHHISADFWHESLNTAREFYPFWMQDIKTIAAFSTQGGFDVNPLEWEPTYTSLKALTNRLATEKFDATDARHLKNYAKALADKGASKHLTETRINLVKILLMQLKGSPIGDNRVYRVAVDSILPLFKADESKQLFLYVIREFYSYWSGSLDVSSNALDDFYQE